MGCRIFSINKLKCMVFLKKSPVSTIMHWGHSKFITTSLSFSLFKLRKGCIFQHPDRAPLKGVLRGQYTYREVERQVLQPALKAAGWEENVIRICAPKKWVAGARIRAHSTGGRCMHRALINTWGRVKGQIEVEWVEVASSNSHVQQVCMQVTIQTS